MDPIIFFFILFGICAAVHETGHYLFARLYGVRVYRFSIFLSPFFSLLRYVPQQSKLYLISWDSYRRTVDAQGNTVETETPTGLIGIPVPRGGSKSILSWRNTTFSLGWLPVMAYVRVADSYGNGPARPWDLRAKKPLQRILFSLGGIMFNLLFALLIFIGLKYFDNPFDGLGASVSLFEAIGQGVMQTLHDLGLIVTHPLMLFTSDPASDGLYFAVASATGAFFMSLGVLSLYLAVFNFLPVPGLDGSRIYLPLYEMITGRKASDKIRRRIDSVGSVIITIWIIYCISTWF